MMKKLLIAVLAIMMVCAFASVAMATGIDCPNEKCDGVLKYVEAKGATCTAVGNKAYYFCDGCSKDGRSAVYNPDTMKAWSVSEWQIPAAHSFVNLTDKKGNYSYKTAPTCTVGGVAHKFCAFCDMPSASTTYDVPALDHDYTDAKWNISSTQPGKHYRVCNVDTCRHFDWAEHTWSVWSLSKLPTCTENGVATRTCTGCGKVEKTQNGATANIDLTSLGHDFEEIEYKPATCTEKGIDAEKCTRCALIINKVETEMLPHTPGEYVVTTPATCEGKGEETAYCTVCEAPVATRPVDALGHKAGEFVETKAATCTEAGEKTQKCTVCDEVLATEAIEALGHTWGEWVVTTPATVEAEGVETKTCSVCGATETRAIAKLPAPSDEPTTEPTVEPTVEPTAEPEKPEEPKDEPTTDGDVSIPKTGDNSSRTIAYVMLTMAIAGLAVLAATKRNAIEK